jgi:hypothetical protein
MIDGVAYMAQGNVPGKFNVSTSTSIEYVKVNPLGSTNSSMQYLGASESNVNTTTVGPLKARQSTQNDAEEGNGSTGRDADMPDFPTSNVDYYINKIIEVAILNGNIMQEEAEKLRATLLTSPQEDLIDTLDAITKEAIQKGLLDKTGKKIC